MTRPLPGDFFLVPMGGPAGPMIKTAQWLNGDGFRPVQHAGIFVGYGRTIEAMPGGAINGWMSTYRDLPIVWSSGIIDLTQKQRDLIVTAALGFKDVPYSFMDYASIGLHRFHIPAPHLKKYIEDSGHMICSQLVDRAYELGGKQLFNDGRWHGDVTPADLYNLLEDTKKYKLSQGI